MNHRVDAQLTAKYWLARHHPELNFDELLQKYPNCIDSIGDYLTLLLKDGEAERHNLYDFFWNYGRNPEDVNEDGRFTQGFVWLERFYTGD